MPYITELDRIYEGEPQTDLVLAAFQEVAGRRGIPREYPEELLAGMAMDATGTDYDSRVTVYEGSCGTLSCVAEADDTCGQNEAVSWCSTAGVQYLILVHGSGGAAGDFTLDVTQQSCDDNNLCTDDFCNFDACSHQLNYDDATYCCTPSTRNLTVIDDNNPCTDDLCNTLTGLVSHPNLPDGALTYNHPGAVPWTARRVPVRFLSPMMSDISSSDFLLVSRSTGVSIFE